MSSVKALATAQVYPGQQLGQGLAFLAHQHGQGVVSIAGRGDASDRAEHADSDFTVFDQFRDIGQMQGMVRGVLPGSIFVYAASCISGAMLVATFHGSSSSMRLME